RSGHPGARMPGAALGTLPSGARVELVAVRPLKLGRPAKTWRAVAPPPGAVRYIRPEGVEWRKPIEAAEPPKETRAAFLGEPPLPRAPAGLGVEISRLEKAHQAILRQPIDQWHLDSIRKGYQALLKQATDTDSANAIRARLDQLARHEAPAQARRSIE